MPPADVLLAFLAAAFVFAAMPGPAILYVTARTLAQGRAAGLRAALGIAIGGLVHVAAAALGLSALFHAVPSTRA
jgi:threonine/homoserine/homoserine lactone efflux protein